MRNCLHTYSCLVESIHTYAARIKKGAHEVAPLSPYTQLKQDIYCLGVGHNLLITLAL